MLSSVKTVAFVGVETVDVEVQIHISHGIPAFHIVGMPDKIVAESKERIRAALSSIRAMLPAKRITVNLSPAGLFKEGSHYDLPIAVGILAVMQVIKLQDRFSSCIILGELSLDGSIAVVPGVLAAAVHARKKKQIVLCPLGNKHEALWVGEVGVIGVAHLLTLIEMLNSDVVNTESTTTVRESVQSDSAVAIVPNMKDVIGHNVAKRAAEIAASGGHNLLMVGPPGSGKSMMAKRFAGILPDLSFDEIIEINVICSIVKGRSDALVTIRPFREPHSSASMASIIGGGDKAMPGEITLAHNGILFLDELPEFSKTVLEALRQPLEDKQVAIARAKAHITYPANFQLIAAMNPCKCGYLNDVERRCRRAPRCAIEYQKRISGPIMSRIDIKVEVERTSVFTGGEVDQTDSATIKRRVTAAKAFQEKRYGNVRKSNALLLPEEVEAFIVRQMHNNAKSMIASIIEENKCSNRDYSKILKIARTIADLSHVDVITEVHIAEAATFFIRNTEYYCGYM